MALDVQSIVGIGPLDNVIALLQSFGFFRVVLPFLLIFAVFYGILIKTGIFGKDTAISKNVSVIIAFVAAFFTIAYTPVVDALAILIPQASFLLVVALLVMMLLVFVIPDFDKITRGANKYYIGIFILVIIGIFIAIVGSSVGQNIPVLGTFAKLLAGGIELTPDQISFFIGLAIVIGVPLLVVFMLTRSGDEGKAKTATVELPTKD